MAQQIIIIGSGICGMSTAIALAQAGHSITLLERDAPPPVGDADSAFFDWHRPGAAQFRHPHAFLGLMCNLLQTHYPELLQAFFDNGARKIGFADMLAPRLKDKYQPEPGDEALWMLLCRRATIETVMRRYVESLPAVTIINQTRVTGLAVNKAGAGSPGIDTVTGVQMGDKEGDQHTIHADLIVDASGRNTKSPQWLRANDKTTTEEKHDAEIIYITKHYRLLPGEQEPVRSDRAGAGDLGYLKYGVFPGDNGHFAIILCLPVAEKQLRSAVLDTDQFDQICLSIPGLQPWLENGKAEGTTQPFGIGDIFAVWREYSADEKPLLLNFFVVGDAAIRTNPLYGRGCSIGILHATLLAQALDSEGDPVRRAQTFDRLTKEQLRPIYDMSLREDVNGIKRAQAVLNDQALDKADSIKSWFRLAFSDALSAAVRDELHVLRGTMRTFNLLEEPGAFLADRSIRNTVLRYMLRGRKRNAASRIQPGPDRQQMFERLNLK